MSAKKTLKTLAKWVGYPLFFLFAFFMFAYLTFPYGRLKEYIIQQVENPSRGGMRQPSGYELQIASLEPSFITGVEASGVRLIKHSDDPSDLPADVTIQNVEARVSVLSLLGGGADVTFDARLAGGSIEGEFEHSSDGNRIDATIDGIRLRRIGFLSSAANVPIVGTLSGDIDLTLAAEVPQSAGEVDLEVSGLTIGDDEAKIKMPGMGDGVTLPTLNAGTLQLRAAIAEGVLTLDRLQGRGDDLELDGEGEIRLARRMPQTQLNVLVRAEFMDSYKERNNRTRALFDIMSLNPRLRAARTTEGALQYRLAGHLATLRPQAAGRATLQSREE